PSASPAGGPGTRPGIRREVGAHAPGRGGACSPPMTGGPAGERPPLPGSPEGARPAELFRGRLPSPPTASHRSTPAGYRSHRGAPGPLYRVPWTAGPTMIGNALFRTSPAPAASRPGPRLRRHPGRDARHIRWRSRPEAPSGQGGEAEGSTDMEKQIVVLGAGYAGLPAAKLAARRTGGRVTLVNASDRFVERVRLHQLGSGQELRDRPLKELLTGTG